MNTPSDTLPLFYEEQFISTDTLLSAAYQSHQESLSGIQGIPIPYSPRTDTFIAVILFACFFVSAFTLARSKRFLLQQFKEFVIHRERTSIFNSSTASDMRYLLLLVLQTCILGGVAVFNYFNDAAPDLIERIDPHKLVVIYMGVCLLYIFFKWVLYSFLGWVFFDNNRTNSWIESYSILIYYLGFALFPFVLFLVYFDLRVDYLVVIGCGLIISTKILMFYKYLKLFLSNINQLFFLILYFCALEVIPFLILYQGVAQLNKII